MRKIIIFTGLICYLYLPVQADTVYCKISNTGNQPVEINYAGLYPNLNKTTDNKAFYESTERIYIDYRASDRSYVHQSRESDYLEGRHQRQIHPGGYVIYSADSKKYIYDIQIEMTVSAAAGKNGWQVEISKSMDISGPDVLILDGSYSIISNERSSIDAFIDFKSRQIVYNGEKWKGSVFSDRFGMAECYWYGFVKPFYSNATVKYWKYNSTDFFIDGMLINPEEEGYFGADLEWADKLDKGYEYTFTTVLDTRPDYILINNEKLVWERATGFFAGNSGELVFCYTPEEDEEITISYVKNATTENTRLDLDAGYWQELYSTRRPSGIIPQYKHKTISKQYVPIEHSTLHMNKEFHDKPVDKIELGKLPELPYPRADFRIIPRGALAAREQIFDVIGKLSIQDAVFSPEDFDVYKNAGVRNLDFLVYEKHNGKTVSANPHWQSWQLYDENPVQATADLMKQWLDMDETHQAYLHFQEVNCLFGAWGKDIFRDDVLSDYGYQDLENKTVQELFQLHIDEISGFSDRMEERIGTNSDRVKRLLLPDRAAINPAYWVKAGADIIIMKNIHRQSVNIVTSAARGMANAYGIEYGFDTDLWDRCTRLGYHPDEFKQIYKVYFHGGGKYLIEEGIPQAPAYGKFSQMGKAWIDLASYARAHPPRGEQIVQIAIIRGFGDEWHTVGSPSSSWESGYYEKTVNGENYLRDYNLLDNVFAGYGTYWNTLPDRLCTGTPYGPVDFIPWEAPVDVLKKYKLIIIMGFNTLEIEQFANLNEYVKQGGKVICAAGQIKSVLGEFQNGSPGIAELFGIAPGPVRRIPTEQISLIPDKQSLEYTKINKERPFYSLRISGENASILERLPDQSPLLIKNNYGKGTSYLFAGEHLTEFGEDLPRKIMKSELEAIRTVTFQPVSDRMEYMVRRKGETIILPVFNHGNAGFPSGKTRLGKWKGEIAIKKDAYGISGRDIAVYVVVYDEENSRMELQRLHTRESGDMLLFKTGIESFEEYVIGSEASAGMDFYK